VLREIECWLAEAHVAAAGAAAHPYVNTHASEEPVAAVSALAAAAVVDSGDDGDDEELEPREAWALDRLCDALLVKGAIVPVSRKKRVSPKGNYPPASLLAIWAPLLQSVAANHAHFPAVLTSHIITRLLSDDQGGGEHEHDRDRDDATTTPTTTAVAEATERASHDVCLAAWAAWLINERRPSNNNSNNNSNSNGVESDADIAARRQGVFFQLVQALAAATPQRQRETFSSSSSSSSATASHHYAGARALLTALCASDRRLADISNTILDLTKEDVPVWCEADLDVMESRVKAALALSRHPPSTMTGGNNSSGTPEGRPSAQSEEENLPNGWRRLSESDGWRPCPIGV